jgi:hypothetical protein
MIEKNLTGSSVNYMQDDDEVIAEFEVILSGALKD